MFKSLGTGAIGVKATLPEAVQLAQKYGFSGVDINVVEAARLADEHGVDYIRSLLSQAHLQPGMSGIPFKWNGAMEEWQAGLNDLPRLAALARQIGLTRFTTWMLPFSDERPYDENFLWHVERFRPIAQVLRDNGCRFGIEFIGPKTMLAGHKYEFIHTPEGLLELAQAIGTGNVGLLLDSWHWYTAHGTVPDLAKLTNDEVVAVHVNDAPAGIAVDEQIDQVRALPAETGVIDIAGFLQALQRIGYDGPVTVEPFSQHVRSLPPEEAVAATAASLQAAWQAAGL